MKKWIHIIIAILVLKINSETKTVETEAESMFEVDRKTNFVDNFELDLLSEFKSNKKYVVVMFHNQPKRYKRLNAFFFAISTIFEQREVFFLQIKAKNLTKEQKKDWEIKKLPTIKFFIYGIEKEYTLELKIETCQKWISQLLDSDVQSVSSLDQIPEFDAHFVVHANENYIQKNPAHFRVLSKLISPISIFTGLGKLDLNNLTGKNTENFSLFFYRKYDDFILPINSTLSLKEKANLIRENEFPNYIFCCEKAKELIIKQKLPVLVYLHDNNQPEKKKIIFEAVKNYSAYLKILEIDFSKPNDMCSIFFKDFLAFSEPESLRILTTHDKIKRYNYVGQINKKQVEIFLKHYLEDNLKPFKIHEELTKGESYKGILKANYFTYQRNKKMGNQNAIYYVYSDDDQNFESHLSQLKVVRSVFRKNTEFKLYLFDHRKNDLDGYLHEKSPFLFMILVTGQVFYFEKEITAENLVKFVVGNIPLLILREPVLKMSDFDEL